jgi:hypothetical protein
MATLPTQSSPFDSLERDTQLRTELEAGFDAALGKGVVSGGGVTKTAAYAVQIATGTKVFAYGMRITLSAPHSHTLTNTAAGTVYLWGKITRTPHSSASPTALDTFALTVTDTTSSTAPTADDFLLAVITVGSSAITSIEEWPAGKALDSVNMVQSAPDTIAVGSVGVVESGRQIMLNRIFTVRGKAVVRGLALVRRF